jgi:hypothetical protein
MMFDAEGFKIIERFAIKTIVGFVMHFSGGAVTHPSFTSTVGTLQHSDT